MIWKEIIKGYSVSEYGDVRNNNTGKILKPFINNCGYKIIQFADKKILVHRLVAMAFIDNPNDLPIVEHIDDNPQNNHYSNLMWSTQKDNLSRDGRKEKLKDYYLTEDFKNSRKKALETRRANGFRCVKSDRQKAKEAARLARIAEERVNVRPSLDKQYNMYINDVVVWLKAGQSLKEIANRYGINKTTGISYFSKRYYEENGIKLISLKNGKNS